MRPVLAAALLAAMLLAPAGPVRAESKELYGTILTNDGYHYWWYAEGYVDQVYGCAGRDEPTGTGRTSAVIGSMWMRDGKLYADLGLGGFDSPMYFGTLKPDGSFNLFALDAIYGMPVLASGTIKKNIVTGFWTAGLVPGCVLHYTITASHLDGKPLVEDGGTGMPQ